MLDFTSVIALGEIATIQQQVPTLAYFTWQRPVLQGLKVCIDLLEGASKMAYSKPIKTSETDMWQPVAASGAYTWTWLQK